MARPAFVILGSGPVALACALWCARKGTVRVLCAPREYEEFAMPRVEVVPIATVAGLVELGVHPHAIGVFDFNDSRLAAWERAEPVVQRTPAAAHLQRPALDRALLALALKNQNIELCRRDMRRTQAEAHAHLRAGACVIDATGRRAALAGRTQQPRKPWVARTFHVPLRDRQSSPRLLAPFMVAVLEHGYAYRALGCDGCTVGIVGRGAVLGGSPAAVCTRLLEGEAGWLVADIATLPWTPSGTLPAAIQWAEGAAATFIGDAALARDALSSQGLACGLTDARYAAEVRSRADREVLAQRSRLARSAHAKEIVQMIAACRWRDHAVWRDYACFLTDSAVSGLDDDSRAPTGLAGDIRSDQIKVPA